MKEYKLTINGNEYVTSISVEDGIANVTVNGQEYKNIAVEGMIKKNKSMPHVAPRPVAQAEAAPVAAPRPASTGGAGNAIKSPLPGVVLDVFVKEGDAVKTGQRLMLLEAMKMENNIESDRDGVVKSIVARKGDSVLEGDTLITIE
ncbi:MAG: biotin/lipoyl-binding protein [Rikenellaceae bacterium]|nr:biotin/lipoyl-binding protein [Rikenellaceae bacterium]